MEKTSDELVFIFGGKDQFPGMTNKQETFKYNLFNLWELFQASVEIVCVYFNLIADMLHYPK